MYNYRTNGHPHLNQEVYCERKSLGKLTGVLEKQGSPVLAVLENDRIGKDEVYVVPMSQLEHHTTNKTFNYQYDCGFIKNLSSCAKNDLTDNPQNVMAIAERQFGPEEKWAEGFDFVPVNNKPDESNNLGSYQVTDVEPDDNIGMDKVMDYDKMKGID
jgi:hypothetical protein